MLFTALTGISFSHSGCNEQQNFEMMIGASVNISSPNYPGYYENNLNCTWTFTSPGNGSYVIIFHSFNIYASLGDEDHFGIWKGQAKETTSDVTSSYLDNVLMISPGSVVVVTGSDMRIGFTSGARFTHRGFLLEVERSHETMGELFHN